MRRTALPLSLLLSVSTLGACHLIKVNGKPLGGASTSSPKPATTSAPQGAAQQAPAAAPAATASAPAAPVYASTSGIRVNSTLAPHPLVTEMVKVRMDDVRADERGWRKCSSGFTTEQPAITWELTEDMTDLKITLENQDGGLAHANAALVLPGGGFVCADKSMFYFNDWKKGSYALFFTSISIGASARLRFESPQRSQREVFAELSKTRTINVTPTDVTPRFEKVTIDPSIHAFGENVNVSCKSRGLSSVGERIAPLARLKVSKESNYHIGVRGASTFVLTEDNLCSMGREKHLSPGTHTLWAILPRDRAAASSYEIEIDDLNRTFKPGEAKTHEVVSLDKPMVITGKVRPSERWGSRDGLCRGAARAPDAYIHAGDLFESVRLSLLWSTHRQQLHVFGPIETAKTYSRAECGGPRHESHTFKLFEGTYAVWVGSPENTKPGSDYHLLVRNTSKPVPPMTTFAKIGDGLSIEHRRVFNHYPFFEGKNINAWETMFTQAPERLFVFLRKSVKSNKSEVKVGEPLLVSSGYGDTIRMIRFDGSSVSANKQLVTTKWPSKIVMPTKPHTPEERSLSGALGAAGPEDKKQIDAYIKADKKYEDCSYKYMKKNDPTWGKGHEVYRISRNGKVRNVGDQVADRAYNKCGGKRIEKMADALIKKLAKTRAQRYQRQLTAVRKRFGI